MIAPPSVWGDDEPTWPRAALGKRVLVAEDHAAMRELLMLVLVERGYDVDSVSTGSEMIRLLSDSSSDGSIPGRFDLIITDVRMPGVSGLDAVDQLRRHGNRTPVLAVTAFPHDSTRSRAQRLEIQLLAKPFDLDTFRDAVHAALSPTLKESCGVEVVGPR